jgi:hypothetical protein
VIGALCDVSSVARLGPLGVRLMLFVTVLIAVHGLVIFGAARLLRFVSRRRRRSRSTSPGRS